ncbi:MAG: hypothetical protein PHN78_01355, partial [Dehalococcoidales bacterium]|nr:hypothetical protein [Dehalococcoidales bacterium]
MAERGFQTELWTDPYIQGLPPEAKLLFIYLWTNKHCNQAGLYEVTLKTMAFDTGLSQDSLNALLKQLEPKVAWYPEQNIIWVKNFLKRQCKSQSFLIAAAKCLKSIRLNVLVKEFIEYNQGFDMASLCEDYGRTVVPSSQHGGTTVPIPDPVPDTTPGAVQGRGNDRKGVVKGKGKTRKTPNPIVAEILIEMKSFLGYPDKTDKDPIPNYAKEGQFLKKMLSRHFTRNEILSCWKAKVRQRRGEFVSMAWVNEDIAGYLHNRNRDSSINEQESRPGERQPDPVQAMRQAGWDTGEESNEP